MTDEEREELKRVSRECNYDIHKIAKRLHRSPQTIMWYSHHGMLTPDGTPVRKYLMRQRHHHLARVLLENGYDIEDAARRTGYSVARVRVNVYKSPILLEARERFAPERHCVECGGKFRDIDSRVVVCSDQCRRARVRKRNCINSRIRKGRDPYGMSRRDIYEPRYRDALWQTFGIYQRAARIAGVRPDTLRKAVRAWGMESWVELCKASIRDVDRWKQMMEEANYDLKTLARHCGRTMKWLTEMIRNTDDPGAILQAPCLHCGKLCARSPVSNLVSHCSDECRRARVNQKQSAAYYRRIGATQ